MHKIQGFSLIELIIFIIILATGIGVLLPLIITSRNVQYVDNQTKAIALAQQRMELIIAQRFLQGFYNFSDPCVGASPPITCNPGVTATIANNWQGNADYKVITVNVTNPAIASLTTLVANYNAK